MQHTTWNIDPILFSLAGLEIHWYGLFFAAAFLFGSMIMKRIYLHEGKNPQQLDSLFISIIVGAIIGARLGHCLFYDPSYYLANPIKIFAIWEGGLASHGGGIGVLLVIYLFAKKNHESYLYLLDRIAIPTALAGFLIRFGNFFNSEIIGTPSTLPWAIIFAKLDSVPRHPVQLYEAFCYLLICILLTVTYKKWAKTLPNGLLFGLFLSSVFTSRFLLEFIKLGQASYTTELWVNTGQLLSLPFITIGLVLIFLSRSNGGESNKTGQR